MHALALGKKHSRMFLIFLFIIMSSLKPCVLSFVLRSNMHFRAGGKYFILFYFFFVSSFLRLVSVHLDASRLASIRFQDFFFFSYKTRHNLSRLTSIQLVVARPSRLVSTHLDSPRLVSIA